MKALSSFIAFLLASTTLPVALLTSCVATKLDGIRALVERRIPQHVDSFTFNIVNGTGDVFMIRNAPSPEGGIAIECTTVSACARGLYT